VERAQALAVGPLPPSGPPPSLSGAVDHVLSGAGGVNFDGATVVAADVDAADSPCPVQRPAVATHIDIAAPPQHTELEKQAFWSTWAAFQLTWVGDFATTAVLLSHPKTQESDPIYTVFGSQNKAGVLGSVAVVHVLVSADSGLAYNQSKKTQGFWRYVLDTLSVGTNLSFTGMHTEGTIHNTLFLEHSKD
jgi:hypothetical protein